MQTEPNSNRDPQLWRLAQARAGFKGHFLVYCLVIGGLWLYWLVDGRGETWPLWPTLGWGIGVLAHFVGAYQPRGLNPFSPEREYDRLVK